MTTSTELTGGVGFTFEDTVVAYYLAALLREERAAGQEGTVTSVAVQQAGHGHPMDDLIVEFKHDDSRRRLSLQIKRTITISAAASNTDFREIITGAVATRATPDFQPDLDVYGFVVENVAANRFRTLNRLVDWAKSSPTGKDFERRFTDGSAAAAERHLRDELSSLIESESPDDEANFYRQLSALKLESLMAGGAFRAEVVNRLQELIASDEDGQGVLLFDRLCRIARDGAGTACTWTRHTLLNQLCGNVRLKVTPNYRTDVDLLQSFSSAGMADVSEEIEGFRVERPTLEKNVRDRMAECRLVNISGLPGCGKSAMLKRIASECDAKGPILFLKSDRLMGTSWLTFAAAIGVCHRAIADLLAEIGTAGTPILFIDGIDRVKPDQKGIITDILRAIESNEHLSNWKVLASSRDQGLEAYRVWFPPAFYRDTGIGDVPIGPFSDNETEALTKEKSNIKRLLWGPAAVHEIARRPFFAAVLARSFPDEAATPQTEVDLIDAWWARAGHDAPEETVPQRQRALLDLAEKGVRNLGKNITVRDLKASTFAQIAALKGDRIIREHDGGASYSFTHDIFFEWVFFRLLIERGADWQRGLTEAGEPPLLGRVVGLLAQQALASPGKWTVGYRDLETRSLRPQWRREWLTAPPFTPAFDQGQKEFQTLLSENDYALLEKLLVWLFRIAPSLPARLLPSIVELFHVWQNFFANISNPRSSNILSICSNWLIDLERSGNARSSLATSLRIIILRSAGSCPEPATTLFKRAVANDRMRGEAYSDLIGFTPMMADVARDHVVALAKAELVKELPHDRIEREEQKERDYFERLKRIRAIPEKDLNDNQRRALKHVHFPVRTERVKLDDIGVVRHHQFYHSTSALHEPFAGLFAKNPEAALRLVRDLANHATKGWRQVHDINRNRMGTPIPVVLEFPWGKQEFWGDWYVYSWFMGQLAPHPLECAFLALSHWAFKQIEGGRPTDEIIRTIVEGNECYAVLGLALVLALETFHVSETSLPIAACQRLWHHDIARFAQEPTRDIDLSGFGLMTRLTGEKAKAKKYLDTRASRSRNVQELAIDFAISPDKKLRDRFKEALARFPNDLPYEFEETRSDRNLTASLKEDAEHYTGLGDIANYRKHRTEDEQIVASYQSPLTPSPEQKQKLAANDTYLKETAVIGWAGNSLLADNVLSDDIALADATALARARDNALMFNERRDVGSHTTQSMIAAIAACVIRFGDPSAQNHDWALDVFTRIEGMEERPDTVYGSKIPWHPTIYLITSLAHIRAVNPSDLELARRLMRLTVYPLEAIRNRAFAALFRDPDPGVAWITAQLALEFAIFHQPEIKKDGLRDNRVDQTARKKSHKRALRALGANTIVPLRPLPPAWVKALGQRRYGRPEDEVGWDDPDPSFNARFAASIFQYFPIEAWCQSDIYKPMLEITLKQFVVWTSERLMPPWNDRKHRSNRNTSELIEWTSLLGDLLARAAPHFETEVVRKEFVAPFLTDDESGLDVLAPFANMTVFRHVLNAPTIPSNTFDFLNDCVDRVVRDQVFDPKGYRAGEVRGFNLPELIRALLFVAIEKADSATRFVNGDWSQINLIMPLVTRLVTEVGWSTFVMDQFLTLCERAGDTYPLDAFVVQANSVLVSIENTKGGWAGTTLPARTAGVVQCLADVNFPLQADQAQELLRVLDALIDLGDRRSVWLEQTEAFKGIQGSLPTVSGPTNV